MPATNTCFGIGWKFDSNGKPALNASAASALIGNISTGEVSVNVNPATTEITGTAPGQLKDKLHWASGTGGGALGAGSVGILGGMSAYAATGSSGSLNAGGIAVGGPIANPFAASCEIEFWAFSDMYLMCQTTANCRANIQLQVSMNGGGWNTVHTTWAVCIQGLSTVAYSSSHAPARYSLAPGGTLTPTWRLLYEPVVGQANAAFAESVSFSYSAHRV